MGSVDIATGQRPVYSADGGVYSSEGLKDTYGIKNEVLPTNVLQVCYLLDVNQTCTEEQKKGIQNGTVEIREYMVVDRNSTARFPEVVGTGTFEQ